MNRRGFLIGAAMFMASPFATLAKPKPKPKVEIKLDPDGSYGYVYHYMYGTTANAEEINNHFLGIRAFLEANKR